MTALRSRLPAALAAVICFALCLGLGYAVRYSVPAFDRQIEAPVLGTFTVLAMRLTILGLLPSLLKIGVALAAIGIFAAKWRARIAFSLGTLVAVHFISDALKNVFERARPEHWLVVRETSYAYPSGHAATAVAFFALWAYWLLRDATLPPRARGLTAAMCGLVAYGMMWSRIALGAHWPSDVAGGALLGLAVICTGLALFGDPAPPVRHDDTSPHYHEELSESSL